MLLLPVQGLAAACAQLCVKAQAAKLLAVASVATDTTDGDEHAHCGNPGGSGESNCCHAHTYVGVPRFALAVPEIPAFEPRRFVARWTSFFPEAPSPPPIASAP
jgi:hypothetical protein